MSLTNGKAMVHKWLNGSSPTEVSLAPEHKLEIFKFYQEAAEKTKVHAWSQTTWILTLNAGIMVFSLSFFAEYRTAPAFLFIEVLSAGVGVVLSGFLIYLLYELGKHIRNYWTQSNRIAAGYAPLRRFVGEDNAKAAERPNYCAKYPAFCIRLQMLAALFVVAHVGWAIVLASIRIA